MGWVKRSLAVTTLFLSSLTALSGIWYYRTITPTTFQKMRVNEVHGQKREEPQGLQELVTMLEQREREGFSWEKIRRTEEASDLHEEVKEVAHGNGFHHQYSIYDVTFHSLMQNGDEGNNKVHATYYVPQYAEHIPVPAVLVLPELSRKAKATKVVAQYLAHTGYITLEITLPHYGKRGNGKEEFLNTKVEQTQINFKQSICDTIRAVDWLSMQPEVEGDKIGVIGISLGAFIAIPAYAADTQLEQAFRSGIFIHGGGDIATALWDSHTELGVAFIAALREDKPRYGRSDLVRDLTPLEPLTYASVLAERRDELLMINALHDTFFPFETSAVPLWNALGHPSNKIYRIGHEGLALWIAAPHILEDIREHLSRTLPLPAK